MDAQQSAPVTSLYKRVKLQGAKLTLGVIIVYQQLV